MATEILDSPVFLNPPPIPSKTFRRPTLRSAGNISQLVTPLVEIFETGRWTIYCNQVITNQRIYFKLSVMAFDKYGKLLFEVFTDRWQFDGAGNYPNRSHEELKIDNMRIVRNDFARIANIGIGYTPVN